MSNVINYSHKFSISDSEYVSLRNELIQRILLINSQATNAITIVLTMWAAGLGLFGIQVANLDNLNAMHNLIFFNQLVIEITNICTNCSLLF